MEHLIIDEFSIIKDKKNVIESNYIQNEYK